MRNLLSFSALLIVSAVPLLAQAADPPARVARVNYLSGSVSFRPGSVEEWTAATLNYPLTTGDHLWADADSRVEIHAGSTAIRMNARTAMSVLNLDDRTVQLSLTDGSLHIRLRNLEDDETVEIDTPNVAITLLRTGEYRIDADGDTSTTAVTVRSGNAEVTGGGVAFVVRPRQSGKAIGMDTVQQDVGPALPQGEFDYWCEARDRTEEEATVSAQYVPREMVGYEDLDRHGVWSEMPDYGPVWRPRTVNVDWAPYRYGHWAWVDPWGWTWIDDAPWGFAPFHYGRWVLTAGGWVWVPGRMGIGRPVYAPALVVFIGTPGYRGAAWFPLGPREVYRPVYRASEAYRRRMNAGHVTNINVTNVYINQRSRGAITAASHDVFVGRRRIGGEGARFDDREFGRATVIGSAPQVAPERASVGGNIGRAPAAPPARVVDRQVTVRRTPPATPVSFDARRAALEANQGRPLDQTETERYRGGAARNPRVRVAAPVSAPPTGLRPAIVQPSAPERPVVIPRDDRPAMRRPTMPAELPRVEQPRVERPAVRVPAPRQEAPPREVRRPDPPRVEAPPAPVPAPIERRRVERPQRADPPPAPRVERAPEPKKEEAPREDPPQNERRIPARKK
jgi:hypothetical protein